MTQVQRRRAPLHADRSSNEPERANDVKHDEQPTPDNGPTGLWQAGDGSWYPAPAPPGYWQASDGNWYPPAPVASATSHPQSQTITVASLSNGMATAALVLGIIGALIGLVPLFFFGAWIFGALALVLGFLGRARAKKLPTPLNRGRATAGVVLGVIALVLGGVGAAIMDSVVEDIDESIAGLEQVGEGTAENPASADVAVTGCEADEFGGVTVTGSITNNSSEMSNYMFSVNVVDDAGTKIGDAPGFESNVAAGQNASWESMAFLPESARGVPFSCELVDVTRLSAE